MGFKDILVAIDAAPSAAGRIELAAGLAERFGAHLFGLHNSISLDAPQARGYFDYFNRSLDAFHQEFAERLRAEQTAARDFFEASASRRSLSAEWRQTFGSPS